MGKVLVAQALGLLKDFQQTRTFAILTVYVFIQPNPNAGKGRYNSPEEVR